MAARVPACSGDFIHSAIVKWYGSKQAFTSYVRCGLKEELASTLFAAKLPYEYLLLIATPTVSLCLEFLLASWKGGVPLEHLVSYSVVVILALGVFWIAAAVMLMIYLCDYFAPCRWGLCDHILTVIIICLVTGFVSAGTQLAAYAFDFGVAGAVLYLCAWDAEKKQPLRSVWDLRCKAPSPKTNPQTL